jgi:hypothetical protein
VTVSYCAMLYWALLAPRSLFFFVLPLVLLALGPMTYIRSWPIWDLFVWDSEQPWTTPPSEQDDNYLAAAEAYQALARHQSAAARTALAKMVDPDPWRRMVNLYYASLADLMDGRQPDEKALIEQVARLDPGPRRASAQVMVAFVASGSANLLHKDWRLPLIECRRELGLRLSVRRVVWPWRLAFVVTPLLLVVLAAALGLPTT